MDSIFAWKRLCTQLRQRRAPSTQETNHVGLGSKTNTKGCFILACRLTMSTLAAGFWTSCTLCIFFAADCSRKSGNGSPCVHPRPPPEGIKGPRVQRGLRSGGEQRSRSVMRCYLTSKKKKKKGAALTLTFIKSLLRKREQVQHFLSLLQLIKLSFLLNGFSPANCSPSASQH